MAQRQTNMTKADMVNEIANRTGLSKAEIKTIIEEFLQLIKESILAGMSIPLRGFGTFFRKKKASKKARNISKGTTIDIPAHEAPAYKASKEFASAVKAQ